MPGRSKNHSSRLQIAASGDPSQFASLLHSVDPGIIGALLDNPNLTPGHIQIILRKRRLNVEHIKTICSNIRWIKDYNIKLEILLNPLCPLYLSLKMVKDMYQRDLAVLSRQTTLHPTLRAAAENYLRIRLESMMLGEKVALARTASLPILRILLHEKEERVFRSALSNFRLPEIEVTRIASDKRTLPQHLGSISEHPRWSICQPVLKALAGNPSLGYAHKHLVFGKIHLPVLIQFIHHRSRDENDRKLARFVVQQRIKNMNSADTYQMSLSHSRFLLLEVLAVHKDNAEMIKKLLNNPHLRDEDFASLISQHAAPEIAKILQEHPRFTTSAESGVKPGADDEHQSDN